MCLLPLCEKKLTLIDKPLILTLSDDRFCSFLSALNYIVLFDKIAEPLIAIASPYRGDCSQFCLCYVILKTLFTFKSRLQLLFDICSFECEAYLYVPMYRINVPKLDYFINLCKLKKAVSVTRFVLDFNQLHNATVRPSRMNKREADFAQVWRIKPQS